MLYKELYLSPVMLACYEGDGTGDGDGAGEGNGIVGDDTDGAEKGTRTFTQEQVNKYLADDRRKTEAKYKVQFERAEKTYNDLLTNKNLSDADRARLEESLEDVRKQMRTKEQQSAHEKKQLEDQYTTRLTDAEKRASEWESRFREAQIVRALQDAAVVNDAYNTQQVVRLLRPMAKMVEEVDEKTGKGTGEYNVVVDLDDLSTEDKPIVTQHTPDGAVKRMKDVPALYGNLFKSNVVSGIGANSATGGLMPGAKGNLDLERIAQDPKLYRKIRAEHPEWLGL
jgi:hypothetical protein